MLLFQACWRGSRARELGLKPTGKQADLVLPTMLRTFCVAVRVCVNSQRKHRVQSVMLENAIELVK